ncbi:NAD(P)-dependent dehydrogenase, short-chain alcohol dehydrogenase family [Natronoarchaeum philippinense]|uniref:NAD(P)-dependent dehydrogenase, short-chain alcohol dehydrogenase family n=1 Tax=Natronoarchaeum philippinense TaxID=558529 RepID=A0A285N6D0_NATPI|nr:SDR family oxidoreductase [Natronoarchaeum philippinense]SNZ05012.1 NAD(P)-dependent dehydrogenase, short-chain alcohol dehydrogenase family [Natronoarchaeum philippinense]
MSVSFDFDGRVAVVTGACGALGSAVVERFHAAGATVAAVDVVSPDDEDALLDIEAGIEYYQIDLTDEADVERGIGEIADDHGGIDYLANVAGTWRGGQPIEETPVDEFDMLFDVNLKTAFLASKHALPHLRDGAGAIVSISSRSSLSGGEGDGPYRASKAGVRLLTETLAEENSGDVRANAVMPSVIDTPANREMMPDADHDSWVDPADIAGVIAFLCSDGASPTSGAAVPVYGEA